MIVKILDVVKDHNNFAYIIMEKFNKSLAEIIEDATEEFISENRIVRIFSMICIPLFQIHLKKMVHRDLKPEHIL
jgi:serine/threonine protein kinase